MVSLQTAMLTSVDVDATFCIKLHPYMSRHSSSSSSSKRPRHNFAEPIFFWLWVAILVWAPIPLGSNRPWAWNLLQAMVFSFSAAWLLVWAYRGEALSVPFRRAWGILLLMAGWLLYQALYFVPIPVDWLAAWSPETLRSHQMADVLRPPPSRLTLSLDPYAARVSWFKSLLYVLVFAMTLLVVSNRGRLRTLAYALVLAALGMSVYGLVMNLLSVDGLWFGTAIPHSAQVSATYVNRNHFAGYLEMMLAVGIGLLIAGLRDVRIETWRQFLRHAVEWILSPKMRLRLMLCVLVIALVATHSRMGNSAFFASLLVVGVIGIVLSRHATRSTVILLVSLIAIDIFIVGSWFGVDKLAQRIESTSLLKPADGAGQESVEQRAEPAKYALMRLKKLSTSGEALASPKSLCCITTTPWAKRTLPL